MAEISLSLLVLRTSRLEAALAFYRTIGLSFAAEKHGSGPEHYSCPLGNTVIELYPGADQPPLDRRGNGATQLGFTVTSLDSVLFRLSEISTPVVSRPKTTPWGRSVTVLDPDGRAVTLTE